MATIWHRYLVNDRPALDGLKQLSNRMMAAAAKSRHTFCLLINRSANLQMELDEEMMAVAGTLIGRGIVVITAPARGAGNALFTSLFSWPQDATSPVNVLLDGDQWDISRKEVLDVVDALAARLSKDKLLFGLGARDRVVLGIGEDDLVRQVEETYFARMMQPRIELSNPLGIDLTKVPASYRKYGDPIPGFYAVNTAHPKFTELRTGVQAASMTPEIAKWAGDPYTVIKAAQLAEKIISIYAPIIDNPPGTHDMGALRRKTVALSNTDIGTSWGKLLQDEKFASELGRWYPATVVQQARELMLGVRTAGS